MINKIVRVLFTAVLLLGARCLCQNKNEVYLNKEDVSAIRNFELKLEPVLSKACADKDYRALRSVKGEVNEYAQKIYSIRLKGELKDKKASWDAGIKGFRIAVSEYYKSVSGNNSTALLEAAVRLHAAFEKLLRIIRPVSLEIDEFQSVFYLLYNKYLPNEEYDKMLSLKEKLVDKAEAIKKGKVPEKFLENLAQIQQAEDELLKVVKKFASFNESSKAEDIEMGAENIHQKLEDLNAFF